MQDFKKQIQGLQTKIDNQTIELKSLSDKIDNPKSNFFKDFIYPVILSMIAAVIFWFVFSYIPEKNRKNDLRNKIDFEIYQVYSKLFGQFDIIMSPNNYSASNYQNIIRGNQLKKIDIKIGLQNKCLNEHYFFDPNIRGELISIGKKLFDNIKKIDKSIDQIFNFNSYLDSEEILLLKNIRNKLHHYDLENYSREPVSIIGDLKLYPINPSLSYMTDNFSELYQLYIELQKLVFSNNFENSDLLLNKVQHYYYNKNYEKSIKEIKKGLKLYTKHKQILNFYLYLCKFKLNDTKESYRILEDLFKSKPDLIGYRYFIKEFLSDREIEKLLNKYFFESEIAEFHSIIDQEELMELAFIKKGKELEEYYIIKSDNNKRKK